MDDLWEKLAVIEEELSEAEYPLVTIVIPTFNSARAIGITIDNLLIQNYPSFEIIIIDAASKDKTIELINGYHDEKIRLVSVTGYNPYEMLNKGISLAQGQYINFLFPGDYYIHQKTLRLMLGLVKKHYEPDLAYCGSLLREAQKSAKVLYRTLNLKLLMQGKQPTSLQACWFKLSLFQKIGKFNTNYMLRGGYELLCRLILNEEIKLATTSQVMVDYDLQNITKAKVRIHFWETFKIIIKYFGFNASLKWLFLQTDITRYINLCIRSFKMSMLGR